jgi:2-dehydropantoate 2-reductase
VTIVVVGGGAIGLLVAGRLASSSHTVAVLARPRTVDALTAQPLRITHNGQTQTIEGLTLAPTPSDLLPDIHQPDLAILSVKSYDTEEALPTLAALAPRLVLTLQNGLGNEETLAEHFGAERVLSGIITSSVEPEAPDSIVVTKAGGIGLAPVDSTTQTSQWAEVFRAAGFPVHEMADYRAMKWSKALLNMLGNATAAILDMPVEAIYADPRLVALERRTFLEGLAVMRRRAIRPINLPGYPAALLALAMRSLPSPLLYPLLRRAIAGGRGGKAPSLQRDMQQGRARTEGDYLYGAVARAASEIGVPAPVNATLADLLGKITSGILPREHFQQQPDRLLDIIGM